LYDPSALYVDPILSNVSIGYKDQQLYGERIFPVNRVRTASGRYRIFDRSNWIIFPSRREPGTVANEVRGGKWSEDTFKTVEHALQSPIFDEERRELSSLGGFANSDAGVGLSLNPEVDATKLVTRSILLEHELKVSVATRNTANYPVGSTVTLAGTARWDNLTLVGSPTEWWQTVSDPVTDIRTAINKIYSLTGRYPNRMALPLTAAQALENHPRIVSRFINFRLTDPDALRQLTGFDGEIFIVDSVYNAADNIEATESITSFWGTDVWLGVVDESDDINQPTFGKTFAEVYPSGDIRPTENWREEARKADLVRTNYKYDIKIVSGMAGYLIKTAVS
jgi:hypothetical protein